MVRLLVADLHPPKATNLTGFADDVANVNYAAAVNALRMLLLHSSNYSVAVDHKSGYLHLAQSNLEAEG